MNSPYSIKSSTKTSVTLYAQKSNIKPNSLTVIFDINPYDIDKNDSCFTLFSTDAAQSYIQKKTVKDDLKTEDQKLSLLFDGLDRTLNYTLKVEDGQGSKPYFIFTNQPYGNW